jgi:hypothetical protein
MSVQAATSKLLIIETTSGGKISFTLSANPEITFVGQTMQVVSATGAQNFEIVNVAQYYFETLSSGIKELQQGELRISQWGNEQLIIDGVLPSSAVRLYSIDGKEIDSNVTISDGKATVFLQSLPKGVYIISANKSQNIKFNKR